MRFFCFCFVEVSRRWDGVVRNLQLLVFEYPHACHCQQPTSTHWLHHRCTAVGTIDSAMVVTMTIALTNASEVRLILITRVHFLLGDEYWQSSCFIAVRHVEWS